MLDSIHPLSCEQLQLGEGVLLRGADPDALVRSDDPEALLSTFMKDPSLLVGAVREGCTLRCIPVMADLTRGHRTPAPGELLCTAWQVTLTGTLLEMTTDNIAMLLGSECPPLCWVGSMGSGMLLIELPCPASTGGMILRTHRRGLGETDFTITAQLPAGTDHAMPIRIHHLKEAPHA